MLFLVGWVTKRVVFDFEPLSTAKRPSPSLVVFKYIINFFFALVFTAYIRICFLWHHFTIRIDKFISFLPRILLVSLAHLLSFGGVETLGRKFHSSFELSFDVKWCYFVRILWWWRKLEPASCREEKKKSKNLFSHDGVKCKQKVECRQMFGILKWLHNTTANNNKRRWQRSKFHLKKDRKNFFCLPRENENDEK